MQNLGDYHDLYVKTDVALLADVFENFRNLCLNQYGLDPGHYLTSPGLSWDAPFKKTEVELELLTDLEMHLFVERGMRGGISMVSKRYSKANNPLVPDYDPSKPNKYIVYYDANNLYGWAMCKSLPKKGFRWKPEENPRKSWKNKKQLKQDGFLRLISIIRGNCMKSTTVFLLPRKKSREFKIEMIKNLGSKTPKCKKLLPTLQDKRNYVLHYRNLQYYLKQGMKLKGVHKVLEFEQESWMEAYIQMNTEFGKKAKNNFEKDFYKLMNNSVFGKTMENIRNRADIIIVNSKQEDKTRKETKSPLYLRHFVITKDLAFIRRQKSELTLDKPVYTGMTILDNTKILMYDFYYNILKKRYGPDCELLYTDTDSLLLEIETEDVYEDMKSMKNHFDTSDYPKDHSLHSIENKKVLGKMKDECNGTPIDEYIGLRSKSLYIKKCDKKIIKKSKRVKKCVIKKITHENYGESLFGKKQFHHGMNILRSEKHVIYGMHVNKTSLAPFDSKRWIDDDGIHTKAYGYNPPL